MAWTDFELSTFQSIAKHEAEINNKVNRYTRKAITITGNAIKFQAVPNTITEINAYKSDGSVVALDLGDDLWAITAGTYVRFVLPSEDDYFSILEGTGNTLTSADGNYTLTANAALTWADVTLQDNWQSKIDLAKSIMYDMIYTSLSTRTNNEFIPDIIDEIQNPDILRLASDYKTLELIYMDLYGKIGTTETTEAKLAYYRNQYNETFSKAYSALNFGDYGYIFSSRMARLVK